MREMAKSKTWINPIPDSPFQTPYPKPLKPLMGQAVVRESKIKDAAKDFETPWLRRVLKRGRKKLATDEKAK